MIGSYLWAYGGRQGVSKNQMILQYALKKIPVRITDEGIPQSVIREVGTYD
jgi:hypothetical protein